MTNRCLWCLPDWAGKSSNVPSAITLGNFVLPELTVVRTRFDGSLKISGLRNSPNFRRPLIPWNLETGSKNGVRTIGLKIFDCLHLSPSIENLQSSIFNFQSTEKKGARAMRPPLLSMESAVYETELGSGVVVAGSCLSSPSSGLTMTEPPRMSAPVPSV